MPQRRTTYHSKSLYMIVKKTCKNKFTAFMTTANRYSHASPDIMGALTESRRSRFLQVAWMKRSRSKRFACRLRSLSGKFESNHTELERCEASLMLKDSKTFDKYCNYGARKMDSFGASRQSIDSQR